jgi:hypothetical protein
LYVNARDLNEIIVNLNAINRNSPDFRRALKKIKTN